VPDRYRASELTACAACPGYRVLRDSAPTGNVEALQRGSLGHSALEDHLDGSLARSPDAGLDIPDDLAADVAAAVAWLDDRDWGKPDLVESSGELDFDGVRVTGRLDAGWIFSDGVIVADWKFSPPHIYPAAEDDLQIRAYAAMLDDGLIDFITAGRLHLWAGRAEWVPLALDGRAAIDENREILREVIHRVSASEEYVVGSHCGRCLLRDSCPDFLERGQLIPARYVAGDLPITPENLGQLVVDLDAAQALIDGYRETLKGLVRDGYEIEHGGKRYRRFFRGNGDKYPQPAEVLQRLGEVVGCDLALNAAKVSKKGIEEALWRGGVDPDDVDAFLGQLKADGLMVPSDKSEQFGWAKVPAGKGKK